MGAHLPVRPPFKPRLAGYSAAMSAECDGSGRPVPDDQPSAEPMQCPVCGRAVKIDPHETTNGLHFTVEHHDRVVPETR